MVFLAFAENSVQLVPDSTLFIHIFLILLMIWILNRTLFKPINRVLEARAKMTGGRSGEAQQILQQAHEKSLKYENALREARSEGYRVIEETRNLALSQRETQVETVKDDVSSSVAGEKADLQTQIEKAQAELETNAQKIAEQISSTVLKRPLAG